MHIRVASIVVLALWSLSSAMSQTKNTASTNKVKSFDHLVINVSDMELMKTAGAGDKGRYPSRLATIRKSTSTSKTFWDRKTSRRISVPTTSSTWPIFRWPETLTSAWSGAARFKKHNNTCGTAESITLVRHVMSPARGDPQRACISGIPTATSGSLRCTRNNDSKG